jgi:hypothetical protein
LTAGTDTALTPPRPLFPQGQKRFQAHPPLLPGRPKYDGLHGRYPRVQSKERSLKLFPLNNPNQWDQTAFPANTWKIFEEAIGNRITIYLWMWGRDKKMLDLGSGMGDIAKGAKVELLFDFGDVNWHNAMK